MKTLRYDLYGAGLKGVNVHPQNAMRELGIVYQHATPQSMGDQWWFWNCENVPASLPDYINEMAIKPHDAIGFGLNKEQADRLAEGAKK
jgi:hypothetical protein